MGKQKARVNELKTTLALVCFLVATVFLTVILPLNLVPINFEPFSLVFTSFTYVVTYVSLLFCLATVIATFLWYPGARRKFSSPVKHSGLSVAQVILATTVLIVTIQVCALFLYPDFLYQISFYLFLVSSTMFVIRNSAAIVGSALHRRRERLDSGSNITDGSPLVTVIVPAYNEEKAIGKTVEAVLNLSYINKEIIVVDDGSTDGTLEAVKKHAESDFVSVISKPNGGKWDALNAGIKAAKGELIVCIDADTLLHPDAIQHLIKHFSDPEVAAVAGNVKVGNRHGLLTKLQALEYVIGLNLYRRSEASLRNVTVVAGPIGAFRATVLKEVGLFEMDTYAEDADITLKILKAGYRTVYESHAIAYTEAPTSMTNLAKQRYRWYRGGFQVFSKHKDMVFKRKYGSAGTLTVPWTIFTGVIYPWFMFFTTMWLLVFCFNPISPYTIYQPRVGGGPPGWAGGQSPSSGGPGRPSGATQIGVAIDFFQAVPYIYVVWFWVFIVLEVAIAAYALCLDVKEKKTLIVYTIFHRLSFVYTQDMIRMLSQLEEVFHYPMKWEKMEHQGI